MRGWFIISFRDDKQLIIIWKLFLRRDLQDKIVLEVGSGRGGGVGYIAAYLKPQKIIGIDFSQENIKLARQTYEQTNLSFQLGDAEALPFDSDSFDVVLNLESSHCYGSMTNFVEEVYRVLTVLKQF